MVESYKMTHDRLLSVNRIYYEVWVEVWLSFGVSIH